ncbi:MAG: hypothetical protein J6W60_10255 [Treponema sp.]|nr:hypothetical protein [Treponema sp.]
MSELDFLCGEITRRYGNITRARGPFLYTEKNVRLTDLFQENGKAILGWGGNSALTIFKNVLNRGISGSYDTAFNYRIQKASSDLLGDQRTVLLFSDKKSALDAALSVCPDKTSMYRPWLQDAQNWSDIECVIISPPLAWSLDLYIAAFKDTDENRSLISKARDSFHTVRLPAPISAAAARSIYNMIKALQERSEKDWFIYDKALTSYWERKGPYLYIKTDVVSKERYRDFICHCLDNSVVINPYYDKASIVPFGADKGVFSSLVKNPFDGGKK